MEGSNIQLSDDQWQFLAVLDAFGGPVSAEVAGVLAPLLPGPLFDLIDRGRSAEWLRQAENNCFSLTGDLPDDIRNKMTALNGKKTLNNIVDDVYIKNLLEKIGPEEMLTLLTRTDRKLEAGEYEIDLAHQCI